nr:outer membrane beta-barrel protein [Paracoccus saliphilus]
MYIFSAGPALIAFFAGSGAALAGGIIAPAVDVEPVVAQAEPVAAGSWAGGYAGGSLGYSFGGGDQLGFTLLEDGDEEVSVPGIGDLEVKGFIAGVHAGYRWQRGNWVFGPELGFEAGSVDDNVSLELDGDVLGAESTISSILSLVMKTGYTVNPQTLVYGTFGAARGDFDYTLSDSDDSTTVGYKSSGLVAGMGIEHTVGVRNSVFAEYQYRDFGKEAVDFVGDGTTARTQATSKHSNLKVGMNFRF